MNRHKPLNALVLAPIILLFGACGQIQPDNPDNPDNPDTPSGPDIPAQTYFSIRSSEGENPTLLVMARNADKILTVKTNAKTDPDKWEFTTTADWCHAAISYNDHVVEYRISVSADPWGNESEYLWPRSCELTIHIPGLYKETLKVVQESNVYLRIGNYANKGTLPSSGAIVEYYVDTNLYDWKIENDIPWLKAVKKDRMTLQLSVVPRTDRADAGRYGDIYLYSSVYDHRPEYWEGPIVTFRAIEGTPDISGEDYQYGEGSLWD